MRLSLENFDRRLDELGRMRRSSFLALLLGVILLILAALVAHHEVSSLSPNYSNLLLFSGVFLLVLSVSIYGGITIAIRWFLANHEVAGESDNKVDSVDLTQVSHVAHWWRVLLHAQVVAALAAVIGGGLLANSHSYELYGQLIFLAGILSLILRFVFRRRIAH